MAAKAGSRNLRDRISKWVTDSTRRAIRGEAPLSVFADSFGKSLHSSLTPHPPSFVLLQVPVLFGQAVLRAFRLMALTLFLSSGGTVSNTTSSISRYV